MTRRTMGRPEVIEAAAGEALIELFSVGRHKFAPVGITPARAACPAPIVIVDGPLADRAARTRRAKR